ncbi:MAG: response regulator transcription factor [Prolixibacteraceae bacterium]|jgi:DNA-binding NarL/FixJ family response regulator
MTAPSKEKIILADTQFLVVETLKMLILQEDRYAFAGHAESKQDLFYLLGKFREGVLITDSQTFGYSLPEDLSTIREEFPGMKILVLTNSLSKSDFHLLTKVGIKNIAYKNLDKEELLSAISLTFKGKKYYSDELIDQYIDLGDSKLNFDEPRNLTASEIEIVRMIASGLTTKEIASKRTISSHTVSTHRKNIFRKVGVSNASELTLYAIKAGWIENIEYYI